MKSNNTSIGYVGTVTIEFPHKRQNIHNNGTSKFFELLNAFISRQTVSVDRLPAYIMLYATSSSTLLANPNATDTVYLSLEILNNKVAITPNITQTLDGKEVVLFATTLSQSVIKSGIDKETLNKVSIAILSADTSTILAAADLPDGVSLLNSLDLGLNATVKWQMAFMNE